MPVTKHSVSRDDSIYHAWPDVLLTDSGRLIAVFTQCQHHLDRDRSQIMLCESTDRGRSWTPKRPLTEPGSGRDYYNCARICRLRDGRLVILCDRIRGDENSASSIHLWFSGDEGRTWSQPRELDMCGIVPDKLVELASGRWIIAAHFLNRAVGKLEQYLWYSDDQGESWSDRVTVAADPGLNLCETSIVEYAPGKLVAFLRENSGAGYDIFKTLSEDGGQSWSPVYPTAMGCGHRPVAGFLQDGSMMVTYRYLTGGTQNVFAAFFPLQEVEKTDRRSQRVRIMPLDYDRNPAPDLGYTGWVQFEDGEIYVVNYIKDDSDKGQIRGYSFRMEDVVLPETACATKNVF